MTKKRYRKLARSYFTRLNEWAKENNRDTMDMGKLYKAVATLQNPKSHTRAEWWEAISSADNFGVGSKTK